MPFKSKKQRKWMHANKPKMAKKWEKEKKDEAAERDYKDEYKKFQSSTKSKKYRAELNKYNRKKGTYGNGDGKDASHKGGKIVGFESQSKNRGRAEKSRLKKEARTINVEPNWEGLYRFMMHMKTTDKSAFSRVTNKMGPEWKKIVAMAEKNKWTESVNEWTVKQQEKYKVGTKMKPVKMGKTQRVTKDKKYRILTIRQWLKFTNYAHLTINRTHHIDTMVDGKIKQLPIVFVDKQDKVVKLEHVGENINELVPPMSVSNPAAYKAMLDKKIAKNVKVKTALGNKDHKDHKKAKSLYQRFMDKFKKKKDKPKKAAPKKQSKSDADFYKRQFTGENIKTLKEKMSPEQFHRYMQYVFDTQF